MNKKDNRQDGDTGEATTKKDKKEAKNEANRKYEKELLRLQVELAHLQAWVKTSGARIVIIFEGRDAAGKGGMIKRITEWLSPRVFRVVALPRLTEKRRRSTSSVTCSISPRQARS